MKLHHSASALSVLLLAIAMTRQPAAVDFLLERLETTPKCFDDLIEEMRQRFGVVVADGQAVGIV